MFVVAGVTGHVGGVAARELLAKGEPVKVIVRDTAKGREWSALGAEVAQGTLEDPKFLAGALRGAKGFFALLPPNFQTPTFYAFQRSVADSIVAAVKESGVPHVVLLSSIGADLAEGNGPIKGVHFLENGLRATGTKLTAIRAGSFQENVGNVVGAAKSAGIYPNMSPSVDYPLPMIASRDIGLLAAHELLFESPKSEIIDLHGPAYTVRQVAELLGAALGKKLNIVNVPPEGQVAAFKQAGMQQELAESFAEMNAGFASGRIMPKGDRLKTGTTRLETTIKTLV
jgi:uncharacterized protein YbjT (DUF2867 family)